MGRKILSLCLAVLILSALSVTAFAWQPDAGRTGSITVTLAEKTERLPIVGAELSVYCVASAHGGVSGPEYRLTDAFEGAGLSLEDPDLSGKLDRFVETCAPSGQTLITDVHGRARLSDLPQGLYFVKQTGAVEGFAPCASFLVSLPDQVGGAYVYDIHATPKTEAARPITVTVKKVWNTDGAVRIPERVTVQLLRDQRVVETAVLDAENNWQAVWENLPQSDGYAVEETDVPQGFTVTYDREGYAFTVINSAALPQTGQTLWPIPVLAAAGLLLIALGVILLGKKRDAHG